MTIPVQRGARHACVPRPVLSMRAGDVALRRELLTVFPTGLRTMFAFGLPLAFALGLGGCALVPHGLRAEEAAVADAGAALHRGNDVADLPVPVDGDDWRTLLRRALAANGDVRAAWFEWKAATLRVTGASGWPNTNVSVGYSYLFSNDRVKTFNRMTFNAGFDAMKNLSFPGKTMAAGRVALAEARSTGERFRAAKFKVQRRVLDAWLELVMAAENARLADEGASLAAVASDAADAELGAGKGGGAAFAARISSARVDAAATSARAKVDAAKAMLAGLAAMDGPASIATPTRLPAPRALPPDPSSLLAAVEEGPDVMGMRADRKARSEEKDLAELQWIPDVNPYAAATGSVEQVVGAVVVLPTTIAELRSGVAVARAMRGAAAARLAQARRDKRGELAAALVTARDAERERRLLEDRILPAASSAASAAETAFTTGKGGLAELVEARRLLVDVRVEIAAAAIDREKQLAAIEEILGADLETFTGGPVLRVAAATPELSPSSPGSPEHSSPENSSKEHSK